MPSVKTLRAERKQGKQAAAQRTYTTRTGSDGVRVSARTTEEEEEAKRKERQNEYNKKGNEEALVVATPALGCVVM